MALHPAKFCSRFAAGRAVVLLAILGFFAAFVISSRAEFSNLDGLPNGADLRGVRRALVEDPTVPVPLIPVDDLDTQYGLVAETKAVRLLLGHVVRVLWLIVGLMLVAIATSRLRFRL